MNVREIVVELESGAIVRIHRYGWTLHPDSPVQVGALSRDYDELQGINLERAEEMLYAVDRKSVV